MATFKAGDPVVVQWGLDEVAGTILSLFGPPGKQFARVEVELPGDTDAPELEMISLPLDLLHHASAA